MNERGNIIEQKVQYQWRPILCKFFQKTWTWGRGVQEEEKYTEDH